MNLSPLPIQKFFDNNGRPLVGGQLFTYIAGTSTKIATYTDSSGVTQNANPIVLDYRGECRLWINAALSYKFVLSPRGDSDPPTKAIWSVDNITYSDLILSILTQQILGQVIYPRTLAEIAAGITPTFYIYPEGDLRRYGGDATGIVSSDSALQQAVSVGISIVPQGCTFRITTAATKTGRVVMYGFGVTSRILCDSNVLTITNGSDSICDNFYMENITAPWIITRNPANWLAPVLGTLTQSNGPGYQPTDTDADVYPFLTVAQQTQQIGPQLAFYGNTTGIKISRIFGRFVTLYFNGARDLSVHDCDFRGGKSVFGAIQIDNYSSTAQTGQNNRVFNNTVTYASHNGCDLWNNEDFFVTDNKFLLCGESGVRTHPANSPGLPYNYRGQVLNNVCNDNYFDGLDMLAQYPVPDDVPPTHHKVSGNYCYRNGGDGINLDGRYNSCNNNHLYLNGRYGIWNYAAYSKISDNYLVDNNQERNVNWHDILLAGATGFNHVNDNHILGGAGQNNKGIFCFTNVPNYIGVNYGVTSNFELGSAGNAVPIMLGNNDDQRGNLTQQAFSLLIQNSAGTIQHSMRGGDINSASLTILLTRIASPSTAFTNTPTGADASTAFAAGGKISSASTNIFFFDTGTQNSAFAELSATIIGCSTGDAITVNPIFFNANVNGVTRNRLAFSFSFLATDAPYALTAANIGAGEHIYVRFYGKLA